MAHLAGFEFMAAPERTHHFDDHFVRQQALPKMFLSPHLPVRVSKVRRDGGRTGAARRGAIPAAVAERLRERWTAVLAGPTGGADYSALRELLREEGRVLA